MSTSHSEPSHPATVVAIREELRAEVARRLDVAPEEVDDAEGLLDAGLSSITVIRLIGRLKQRFGVDLREQVFGENPSLTDLATALADASEARGGRRERHAEHGGQP